MEDNKLKAIHILADFYKAKNLEDMKLIEKEMISAAKMSGAKVLNSYFHYFKDKNGFTGIVLLSESHISIHTWPELSFVAIDAFMCGNVSPMKVINYLKTFFKPKKIVIKEFDRGV